MFPIIAIGSAIGAGFSIARGVSWIADKLGSAKEASPGEKTTSKAATQARASQFETALAAQVAGQTVPVSMAAPSVPVLRGTDYDLSARLKTGIVAYNRIGEHRHDHATPRPAAGDDSQTGRA